MSPDNTSKAKSPASLVMTGTQRELISIQEAKLVFLTKTILKNQAGSAPSLSAN